MNPCADKKETIALLVTGVLTAAETAIVRGHLEECATCSAYASQLGAICAQLGESVATVPMVEPPPGFHARLKHRIQPEQEAASPASLVESLRAMLTPARLVSAIAILTLAVGLAFWMGPDRGGSTDERIFQAGPPPVQPGNGAVVDLAKVSTLMVYQAAFNRSFEDLDALVTQNSRRSSTPDGMTMLSAGPASF